MTSPDFNLLVALDVLLSERSVARAAGRLALSPSAMSRALARLRTVTGDPLLVRAGQRLVPTPRALELRDRVRHLVEDVGAVLRPADIVNTAQLVRTFTLRTSEGFLENFGAALLRCVHRDAPHVRLRFVPKANKDATPLRDGTVDLETGVVEATTSPELRMQALFRDRYVGVVRKGHPLSKGRLTTSRYATGRHISVSRRGLDDDPIDEALAPFHVKREVVVAILGGFSSALALARASDLIVTLPERHSGTLRTGMHTFLLPFAMAPITISLLWHPRLNADPAHRWLRDCVNAAVGGDSAVRRRPGT